jgi:hypothetical protein
MPRNHPNCYRCRHFRVTWETGKGYACQAMGFKSPHPPWQVVLRESGRPCLLFSPKPPPAGPAGGKNYV